MKFNLPKTIITPEGNVLRVQAVETNYEKIEPPTEPPEIPGMVFRPATILVVRIQGAFTKQWWEYRGEAAALILAQLEDKPEPKETVAQAREFLKSWPSLVPAIERLIAVEKANALQ